MALVKYNNNSISAVTSAAAISSGALVPIKTLTASSSATLSFVHGSSDVILDSTYPIYVFKFINCHPATDSTHFSFQGSTNSGSSYGLTITSTSFQTNHKEDGSGGDLYYWTGGDLAQSTNFQRLASYIDNDADSNTSGELYLFNPYSTTFAKQFKARMSLNQSSSSKMLLDQYTGGYFNTTSAINAIQFKMESGNVDAGIIKLYGIKDS
tara:strand:+ start:23 stop:652 length:630 start_codon:yes stop_codon:yes gene_type:complete